MLFWGGEWRSLSGRKSTDFYTSRWAKLLLTRYKFGIQNSACSQMEGVCLLPSSFVFLQHISAFTWMTAFPWDQFGLVSIDLSRRHWPRACDTCPLLREGRSWVSSPGLQLMILFHRPRHGVQMVVSSGGYGNWLAQRGRCGCEVTFCRSGAHAEIPGDVRVRRPRMTFKPLLLLNEGCSSPNAVL